MCARRFLIIVFVLTLLTVGAAFAIYQWGGNVLLRSATPKGHFEEPPPAGALAYADLGSWIARPDMPAAQNPALWRPANWPPPTLRLREAAVFYVHPTTYLLRDRWNAPAVADAETEARTRLFVQSQAGAFADVAEVWAPRYRQAAYGAFLLSSADANKALALAYGDVEAAFDEFLRQQPSGRPIILAAHSQGSLHLSRLLSRRGSALKDRVAAAYVVGWPLSRAADLPAMGLPECSSADQAGCLLSWQSFAAPANPGLVLGAWEESKGPTGLKRRRSDMVCVNPLTGSAGGTAPPASNPGTLVPTADLASAVLEPGRVGAKCERGLLLIDGDIPPLGPYVLPGNNYHVYDYALFWGAIRRDAERRLRAWRL